MTENEVDIQRAVHRNRAREAVAGATAEQLRFALTILIADTALMPAEVAADVLDRLTDTLTAALA